MVKEPTYNVVAEAVDGLSVLQLIDSGIKADILLTDISMPGMDGMELLGNLQTNYPQIKSIVLSAHDNEQYVAQAFRAGAAGYLLKSISADELIFAVKHVAKNNQYVASQISMKILNRMLTVSDRRERVTPHGLEFSDKEVEILELIGQGYTNQQIADKIFTGKRTVEGYRQGLIDKTGARDTAALVRFAVVNGPID